MKIALIGDLAAFDNGLLNQNWKNGLKEIKKYLEEFDLVVANLETPITDKVHTKSLKGIHIKSDNRIIDIIKYLGIDAVSLANNHMCDFEKDGLESTILALKNSNIEYFGVNNKMFSYIKGNVKLLFCGFCCYSTNGSHYIESKNKIGINALTYKNVEASLKYAKYNHFLPIISMHWGEEYTYYPNTSQIEFAHKLADEYNYVLYGHHTHVMQGIEYYNNSILAYSLGNFYFDDCQSPINKKLIIKQSKENKESFILTLELNGDKITYNTQGIKYDNYAIKLIDNNSFINSISNSITLHEKDEYKKKSKDMKSKIRSQNLVPHNFRWVLSKMNYHSIGAKIISYYYKYKFKGAYNKSNE